MSMKTQIGIIGAGPAGLLLAHLLHQRGIDCTVLETRNRSYIENRIRAGVLEQGTVEIIDGIGLGTRMHKEGLRHNGIELGFRRTRRRIDFPELTGKSVMVYGQHEVIKDLVKGAEDRGIPIIFAVTDTTPAGYSSNAPHIEFRVDGEPRSLACDYIVGCDGFHGVCRAGLPVGAISTFEKTYPYAWLGILAAAAPSQQELVYMHSERGFALFSMRSPAVTRLYLQVDANDQLANWSDDRIWSELFQRLSFDDGWRPNEGTILQKSITPMRSFVSEPMQFGRMFMAGDAVHIVPPTGAKGMNLAASDVRVLAEGFSKFYADGDTSLLDRYSDICLRRIWRAQRFSGWMTSMLHRDPSASPFEHRRQIAELDYVTSSVAAATSLAENYVGLPIDLF